MKYLNANKNYVLLIFILNINLSYTLQAQQFKAFRNHGPESHRAYSSDGIEINLEIQQGLAEKDSIRLVQDLIKSSSNNRSILDYNSAFQNAGDALYLAEELKDTLLMAMAFEEVGILNYLYKQDELAGENFKKSYTYFNICYSKNEIPMSDLYSANYNMVLYYQRTVNKELLNSAIDSCASIAQKVNLDTIYNLYLNEKRASLYEWEDQPVEALKLLKESIATLNAVPSDTNKSFLIILYARLANIYKNLGNWNLSKINFEKSTQIEDTNGEHTFYRSYVFTKYAELLFRLDDYKKAYDLLLQANTINEKYLNPRNDSNQGFLTIRNRYNEKINEKNKLLILKNQELANQTQKNLRLRIYFFAVIFLVVITGLLLRSRTKLIKHQKKERDSKQLLDHKNKELTVNTLQLIEREKLIKLLNDHIDKSDLNNATRSLLKSIEKRSVSLWEDFNHRFLSQNEGFYERLKEKVPDLSSADLKICALIKLNFSGKEMAYLLGISLGSVHVARHRLRKKMNIDRDVNLSSYINSV